MRVKIEKIQGDISVQIGNINFGSIKKTKDNPVTKNSWFNRAYAPDKFEKSANATKVKRTNISVENAVKNISEMKNDKGEARFNENDIKLFEKYNKKGTVHYNMVTMLADTTDFNMNSIVMAALRMNKNRDYEWKLLDTILTCAKELPEGCKANDFEISPFEPDTEMSLSFYNNGCSEKFHFDYTKDKPEIIGKSKSFSSNLKGDSKNIIYITESEDYKNNLKSRKEQTLTKEGYPDEIKSEVIEHYNKNRKLLRKDIMTESDIEGVYNIKYEFPDGKSRDIVKATVDPKTGIKTIKKDMRSSDGTRTEFLYEDDPKGNRIIDYKITGIDGKIIMKNSQTFEVVDENHFISSKNGHKYDIQVDEKGLKVKDIMHSGKETSIEFDNMISGNQEEIVKLLKKVPGEELFDVVDCCNGLNGKDHDQVLASSYNKNTKYINIADNLYVFLHELGHAKDSENIDALKCHFHKIYEQNPKIQKIYIKEREEFNKAYPHAQREHIDYFIRKDGHYAGEFGGLQEVIAETNAITNSYTNGDVKSSSARSQYLQQHFPKTIAAIQDAMYYKNDFEALEYYGT